MSEYKQEELIEIPEFDDTTRLADLIRPIVRQWRFVAVVTVVSLLLASAYAFLKKPYYRATTSFIPPTQESNSSFAMLAGQLSMFTGGSLSSRSSADLYRSIMRSHTVLGALVNRFHLESSYHVKGTSVAEAILKANTDITIGQKDGIVTLEVTSKSAPLARDLANGYLEELQHASGRLSLTEASQRRSFFEQQLAREKDALANAEVELKRTQEKSGLVAPSGQLNAEFEVMTTLRAQIATLRVQLASLLQSSTEQNPKVIALRSQIASLQGQLAQMQNSTHSGPGSVSVSQVPAAEADYIRAQREVKYHETLMDMLAKQYEGARIDEARDSPLFQVLDPATLPEGKAGPNRPLIMFIGVIFGFMASVLWLLARECLPRIWATIAP